MSLFSKCLQDRSVVRLDGDHRGDFINCLQGALWVTQPGDAADHIVRAGERFTVSRRGAVLISGLGAACVEVSRAA